MLSKYAIFLTRHDTQGVEIRIFLLAWLTYLAGPLAPLSASAEAHPDLPVEIARCRERDSNFQRLQCYDDLAEMVIQKTPRASAPLLRESPPAPPPEKAPVVEPPAPPHGSVELLSRREVPRASGEALRPRLIARCGVKPSFTITLGAPVGAAKVGVNTRVDRGAVVKEMWSASSDRLGVAAPRPRDLLARLRGGDVLEVKVTPKKGAPIPFSFELAPLLTECGGKK